MQETVEVDETDLEILKHLDQRGEVDADALSDELDISPSTVYYRLENFRENGIIDRQVTKLNPKALGFELTAITRIQSAYGDGYHDIEAELAELSGVQEVYQMLGEMSFVVISRVRDHDHLQRLVGSIIDMDGVVDSSTSIVLRTVKSESRLLVNYDDDELDELVE